MKLFFYQGGLAIHTIPRVYHVSDIKNPIKFNRIGCRLETELFSFSSLFYQITSHEILHIPNMTRSKHRILFILLKWSGINVGRSIVDNQVALQSKSSFGFPKLLPLVSPFVSNHLPVSNSKRLFRVFLTAFSHIF